MRQDDEGHLILRFAGTDSDNLEADQREEIVNAFVSVMVHDRLRADVNFEAERTDAAWAEPMQGLLGVHLTNEDSPLQADLIECRSATCRIVFEHPDAWRVSEHQALMGSVQRTLEAVIAAMPANFSSSFLLAGYYQESESQHIRAYLSKVEDP